MGGVCVRRHAWLNVTCVLVCVWAGTDCRSADRAMNAAETPDSSVRKPDLHPSSHTNGESIIYCHPFIYCNSISRAAMSKMTDLGKRCVDAIFESRGSAKTITRNYLTSQPNAFLDYIFVYLYIIIFECQINPLNLHRSEVSS